MANLSRAERHETPSAMSADERCRVIIERLERDLRTRFPTAELRLVQHEDDSAWIRIDCTDEDWGEAGLGRWFESPLTNSEIEVVARDLAVQLADNCWPDECTDPWPTCPAHPDHPLDPGLRRGVAVWLCHQDHRTNVRIGFLDGTLA
jgi:hypothetical protein